MSSSSRYLFLYIVMFSSDQDELFILILFLLIIFAAFVLTALIIVIEDTIEHRRLRWRHR